MSTSSSKMHTSEAFNTQTYFQDIGAWPSGKILIAYITGFIFSILCTILAYLLATYHFFSFAVTRTDVISFVVALAVIQFILQIMFFFHLGREVAARERLIILGFTGVIIAILVSGSLWIMFTLNTRMMPSTAQMEQYMNSQQGI